MKSNITILEESEDRREGNKYYYMGARSAQDIKMKMLEEMSALINIETIYLSR